MLTDLQSQVAKIMAENRSQSSYFAGGAVLNEKASRQSDDLDVFTDTDDEIPHIVTLMWMSTTRLARREKVTSPTTREQIRPSQFQNKGQKICQLSPMTIESATCARMPRPDGKPSLRRASPKKPFSLEIRMLRNLIGGLRI